ncbi:endo-1,4-beta-xylanase [Natronorubrum texcoconense]|nr:endo-1,4-beta-xylanase [Natronorubrum texcoconense]
MPESRMGRPQRTARSAVHRRPVLWSLGALAGASGLGVGVDGATALGSDGDDWEAAADERIRNHRTADLEIVVTDVDGNAIDGADVDVELHEHEYGFGTAVDATTLINETEAGDEYRQYIPELFNTAVLENQHKWRFFEEDPDLADDATAWLGERGLDMRGHTCLWGNVDAWAVPPDVVEAMGIEWEDGGATDPDLDPEYVRERSFEHLEEIITRYGDEIDQWDVVNEVFHEPSMIEAIDGDDVDPVEAPVLAEWYRAADELGEELGVAVDVNDYNTLAGPHEYARESYRRQIEFLLEEDVDLDGIGMQCHFSADETLTPEGILDGLDEYADYGAELRVTEFDTEGGPWEGPEEKGEFLYTFLKTVFSHPDTTDFLMWGFWDGEHWRDEAPLFFDDWEPKPAYDAYTDLVFGEWWTDETGETEDGTYQTSGFKGEYEITARYDGTSETTTTTLADGGATVEIELEVDATDADDSTPGLGVSSAVAGLLGLAGYALVRGGDERDEK